MPPHQVMWKMNELCLKIDLIKVVRFGNTQITSEILSPIYFNLFLCLLYKLIFRKAGFFSRNGQSCLSVKYISSKIKNICFAKFRKSCKITSQLMKYASQFGKCEARIRSLYSRRTLLMKSHPSLSIILYCFLGFTCKTFAFLLITNYQSFNNVISKCILFLFHALG